MGLPEGAANCDSSGGALDDDDDDDDGLRIWPRSSGAPERFRGQRAAHTGSVLFLAKNFHADWTGVAGNKWASAGGPAAN